MRIWEREERASGLLLVEVPINGERCADFNNQDCLSLDTITGSSVTYYIGLFLSHDILIFFCFAETLGSGREERASKLLSIKLPMVSQIHVPYYQPLIINPTVQQIPISVFHKSAGNPR